MGRKRSITSDMSTDERLASIAARDPLAAALWPWFLTALDDWGRAKLAPVELKLSIFPAYSFGPEYVEQVLQLYADVGLVVIYAVDGRRYWCVPLEKWLRHQSYINKQKLLQCKPKCPPPPEDINEIPPESAGICRNPAVSVPSPSPSPSPSPIINTYAPRSEEVPTSEQLQVVPLEGKKKKPRVDSSCIQADQDDTDWAFEGRFFKVGQKQVAAWAYTFPAIDVLQQIKHAHAWIDADPRRKKTQWKKFLVGWLGRAQQRARLPPTTKIERTREVFQPGKDGDFESWRQR